MPTVVCWDWKEQPEWEEINDALKSEIIKRVFEVQTGQDMVVVVVGCLDEAEAQAYYNAWVWENQ